MEQLGEELLTSIFQWLSPPCAIGAAPYPLPSSSAPLNAQAQDPQRQIARRTFLFSVPLVCRQWHRVALSGCFWNALDMTLLSHPLRHWTEQQKQDSEYHWSWPLTHILGLPRFSQLRYLKLAKFTHKKDEPTLGAMSEYLKPHSATLEYLDTHVAFRILASEDFIQVKAALPNLHTLYINAPNHWPDVWRLKLLQGLKEVVIPLSFLTLNSVAAIMDSVPQMQLVSVGLTCYSKPEGTVSSIGFKVVDNVIPKQQRNDAIKACNATAKTDALWLQNIGLAFGASLRELELVTGLECCDVTSNDWSKYAAHITNLRSLVLKGPHNLSRHLIATNPNIESLTLFSSECHSVGIELNSLLQPNLLQSLRVLDIVSTNITPIPLEGVFSNLVELNINHRNHNPQLMTYMLRACPQLRKLTVSDKAIHSSLLWWLPRWCPHLQKLSARLEERSVHYAQSRLDALQKLAQGCQLTSLSLASSALTDTELITFLELGGKHLQQLNVSLNPELTGESLAAIQCCCPDIRKLELAQTSIYNEDLHYLPVATTSSVAQQQHLLGRKGLEVLSLSGTKVTPEGLAAWLATGSGSNLRTFNCYLPRQPDQDLVFELDLVRALNQLKQLRQLTLYRDHDLLTPYSDLSVFSVGEILS